MSTTIAGFRFENSDDCWKASKKLFQEFNYGSYETFGTYLAIYDNCPNPSLARKICIACGGVPE